MTPDANETQHFEDMDETMSAQHAQGDQAAAANDASADPTPKEAKALFEENPGLWSVKTTAGVLRRDGTFE